MYNITKKIAPHSYSDEFVKCLEQIEGELGWDFFNLTGIGDQLDTNKFGKQFFKTDVTADASVDPNSNVSDKSVVAYHFEASKPNETINALYRLWKGLIKYKKSKNSSDIESLDYANSVIKKQLSGDIYINDITGISTNRSYSYYGKTIIVVKYKNKLMHLNMQELFEMFSDKVEVLPDRETVDLRNVNIYVLDQDNKFVKMTHVLKHKSHCDLIKLETKNGFTTVVTEDHPVIVDDGSEKKAIDIKINDKIKMSNSSVDIFNDGCDKINKHKYIIGFGIGDGMLVGQRKDMPYQMEIIQKDLFNSKVFKYIEELFPKYCLKQKKDSKNIHNIVFGDKCYICKHCDIKKGAENKTLPKDILNWNKTEILSLIAGLIDADGTVNSQNGVVDIRLASFSVIQQIAEILRWLGFERVRTSLMDKYTNGGSFAQKLDMYRVSFVTKDELFISFSEKMSKNKDIILRDRQKDGRYDTNEILKIKPFKQEYVYDITTETGHFHCQGLIQHNCYNYCTLDVATQGLPKEFDGEGVFPAKHLSTFFSQLLDFMIFAGNSTLGAVGVADMLITTTCFFKKVLKQCGDDNVNFSSEQDCWKYLEGKFEKFIYDINKPNRSNQSLFSNLSIYDDKFLEDLCPNYMIEIDGDVYEADIETVKKVQQVFIKVYNKEQHRRLMTFPVLTPCFALDSEGNLLDKDFLRLQVKNNQDFKMMNFYGGETSTLSSCCFDGKQKVEIKKTCHLCGCDKIEKINLKDLYHNSKKDDYADCKIQIKSKNSFESFEPIRVSTMGKVMYKLTLDKGSGDFDEIICTDDHIFPTIHNGDIFTKDLNLQHKLICIENFSKYEVDIISIEKIDDYDKPYVYCVEILNSENPYFILENGVLTHNCRLRSKKDAKYMNTIGSGGVKIGSIGVCTINLPRLAHKHPDLNDFYKELANHVEICQTINYVKRKNIKKAISQGRIPLYSHGFININTQYNTVGVIGFNEACSNLGYSILSEEGQNIVLKMMNTMNDKNDEMSDMFQVPTNLEQIPGENVAIKLAKKDRLLGHNSEYELYSNQFIPLSSQANLFDRINLQAKFDKHFGGGSILHINADEFNDDIEKQLELLELMFKKGVIYVAFNNIIGICNDCGQNTPQKKEDVSKDNTGICKKCKSTNVDVALRVVGFVRKVKNWIKERRKEFHNRQFYSIGSEVDKNTQVE